MLKLDNVKIEGHYWLRERLMVSRTGLIIKIKKLGSTLPQKIEGELFDTKTGEFLITSGLSSFGEPAMCVFACELDDEVTKKELDELKNKFSYKLNLFFSF